MKTKKELEILLPKHNQDNYHIEDLLLLSNEQFSLLADDLLIWMKNMHYPVTKEVALVLSKRHEVLKDNLIKNLNDNKVDAVWKYNVIAYVIALFNKEDKKYYTKTLNRIIDKPTKEEIYSEVNIIAKEVTNS